MLFFVFILGAAWVIRQFGSDENLAKWQRRAMPLVPVVTHVAADVRAVKRDVHNWRELRRAGKKSKGASWTDEVPDWMKE